MFAQATYRFYPAWDITAGARQERWSARNGVVGSTLVPDRDVSALSLKVSLGYEPGLWKIRYSFGRAHQFPVIAELFQSLSSPTSTGPRIAYITTSWSNTRCRRAAFVWIFFAIQYKDAIQQVQRASSVLTSSAFQNVDRTSTTGIELVFDQRRILGSKFDFMFNGTWMIAKVNKGGIVKFTDPICANADFNFDGKQRIRLPHWRANFFATYYAEARDIAFSGRYTGDSFNDLDNRNHVNNVFGFQGDFFFMDFKTS